MMDQIIRFDTLSSSPENRMLNAKSCIPCSYDLFLALGAYKGLVVFCYGLN